MFTYAFDVLIVFNNIEFGAKFRIGIYRPYFSKQHRIMLVTSLQAAKVANNAATALPFKGFLDGICDVLPFP